MPMCFTLIGTEWQGRGWWCGAPPLTYVQCASLKPGSATEWAITIGYRAHLTFLLLNSQLHLHTFYVPPLGFLQCVYFHYLAPNNTLTLAMVCSSVPHLIICPSVAGYGVSVVNCGNHCLIYWLLLIGTTEQGPKCNSQCVYNLRQTTPLVRTHTHTHTFMPLILLPASQV